MSNILIFILLLVLFYFVFSYQENFLNYNDEQCYYRYPSNFITNCNKKSNKEAVKCSFTHQGINYNGYQCKIKENT